MTCPTTSAKCSTWCGSRGCRRPMPAGYSESRHITTACGEPRVWLNRRSWLLTEKLDDLRPGDTPRGEEASHAPT